MMSKKTVRGAGGRFVSQPPWPSGPEGMVAWSLWAQSEHGRLGSRLISQAEAVIKAWNNEAKAGRVYDAILKWGAEANTLRDFVRVMRARQDQIPGGMSAPVNLDIRMPWGQYMKPDFDFRRNKQELVMLWVAVLTGIEIAYGQVTIDLLTNANVGRGMQTTYGVAVS